MDNEGFATENDTWYAITMLYDHQKKIIDEDKKRIGLFLGTGSAKTLTALHLAKGKILCVTPKLQFEEKNFQREADKWNLKKDIIHLSKEQFKKVWKTLPYFDTLILDEAHTMAGATPNIKWRNKQPYPKTSQMFEAIMGYIKNNRPERIYTLTATPIRSPMCVWGLSQILGAKWNFYDFREAFYIKLKKGFREFFIARTDKHTKERLGKAVRNIGYTGKLSDYFDVPNQIYKDVYVDKTDEQKQKLKEILTEFPDPLVQIGKRHQIENGVLRGDEYSQSELINDNKIEKLQDYALEFPKMIVFARYTEQIEKIKEALKDYNVLTLQGKTKNRDQVLIEANKASECILIIQSQISAGYELPGPTKEHPDYVKFDAMIFASEDYSVINRVQAEGRTLRSNALNKNLYITLMTRGGIDEAVHKAVVNKVDFNERIYAKI